MSHRGSIQHQLSNGLRLSLGEWLLVAAVAAVVVMAPPSLWDHVEPFEAGGDYRIPFDLSDDYWFFSKWAGRAATTSDVLVLGDSVMWGAYVPSNRTLAHYLNQGQPRLRFSNLGIDGGHPAALLGLVTHYARRIRGTTVLLHLNPIWMSSPRHDLSEPREAGFNHPELVPQLVERIPGYAADADRRLGVVIRRKLPFAGWNRHLQHAFFDHLSIPRWTVDHPSANPVAPIFAGTLPPHHSPVFEPAPWTDRGFGRQALQWADPAASLQWRFFRRTVEILRERDNRVVVVLGPLNEHMLTEHDVSRYRRLRAEMERWLTHEEVPYVAPEALESHVYADLSHPLVEGYEALAAQIMADRTLPLR